MYSKKNPVRMIRNVTLYSIIRPIMKLVLVIYAFINVHDNSWGTKNLNDRNIGLSLKKKYKNYRIKYLSLWFLTNIALILLYFISTTLTINLFIGLMLPYVVFRIISATYFNLKTFSQR